MDFRPLRTDDAQALLDLRVANRDHFQIAEPRHPEAFFTLDRQRDLVGFARLSNVVLGAFHNAYLGYMVAEAHSNGAGVRSSAISSPSTEPPSSPTGCSSETGGCAQ